jgi:Protein of unknown function (DUF2840)
MSDLTHVELLWLEKRIENRIRFGCIAEERILDRNRRVLSFTLGSIFAFVRWMSKAIKRLPTGRCTSQMRPRTLATRLSCRISQHGSGYTRSQQSSADSSMPDSQLRCFVSTRSCHGEV